MSQFDFTNNPASAWQAPVAPAWEPAKPSKVPKVWAASITLLAGVLLLVVAGCFLIGVMAMVTNLVNNSTVLPVISSEGLIFKNMLYVLSGVCGVAGLGLIGLGTRWMWRIMQQG